jgi:hypothetical protein
MTNCVAREPHDLRHLLAAETKSGFLSFASQMKKKIGGLEGRGVLRVEGQEDLQVYYTIAVLKEPTRTATFGEGKLWADAEALITRTGPARLAVRGGDEVDISVRPTPGEGSAPFTTQGSIPGY